MNPVFHNLKAVFFLCSATQKTECLSNEVLILKDDFEEARSALKQKEDEIRVYKEQLEKMGNEDFPKSPMDGDILGKLKNSELFVLLTCRVCSPR